MVATMKLVTSNRSSIGTVQLIPATRVKLEHVDELITILSNDFDGNSPPVVLPVASL